LNDNVDLLFQRYGPRYRWYATATAMVGTIATVLSTTIINVAIPEIMGAYGIGEDKAQLFSTAFLATMTGAMLLNAWMIEHYGQRNTFIFSLSLFVFASILGGVSPNEDVLVLARALQGISAGLVQPLAMLVIFRVFPVEQHGKAMGMYGIGIVLAPALGPTVGGMLVDGLSWRYVFYVAIPFSVLAIVMANTFLPDREKTAKTVPLDTLGLALLSIFLYCLLMGLSDGRRLGWDNLLIVGRLTTAALTGVGFIFWEQRCKNPLLDLTLFANPRFTAAAVVTVIFGAGIFGSTYLIPVFVQTVQHYSATQSGLLLMPAGVVMAFAFPIAGNISDRLPSHIPIALGLAFFGVSTLLFYRVDVNTSFWHLAILISFGRIGLSLIMPAVTTASLRSLPPSQLSQGSGATNFLRQLGGAFGVNAIVLRVQGETLNQGAVIAATQTASNPVTTDLLQKITSLHQYAGLPFDQANAMAHVYLGQVIAAQASTLAYREGFIIVGMLFLFGLLPTWYLKRTSEINSRPTIN